MELYEYFLIYILALSAITFIVYAIDKIKAQKKAWRIPEKALLTLSFIGGALGGLVAMYTVRHKTKHWYFTLINVLSIGIHSFIAIYLFNLV